MLFAHTKGFVESVDDPALAGRVLCRMAELDDATYPEWISPIFNGDCFFPPNVGDTVMLLIPEDDGDFVEFADEIYYLGVIRFEETTAPTRLLYSYPKARGIVTPAGNYIVLDDSKDNEFVSIGAADGVPIHAKKNTIHLGSELANQPLVLGTELVTWLGNLCTALKAHALVTTDPALTTAVDTLLLPNIAGLSSSTVFTK